MNDIVLYCKSFGRDVNRAKILLDSTTKFNKDNIPFYISVPSEDITLFKNVLGTTDYILLSDEEVMEGIKYHQDWRTQQIIKTNFWKLGLCHNWLMIDSDSIWIKDFHINDFIVDKENHIPYQVIHQQKTLFSWTAKNSPILGFDPKENFEKERQSVMEIFGRKGVVYDFGPGPVIFSSLVWKSLEDEYLIPNNLKFDDLINNIPSEFSWYGEWELYKKSIGQEIIPLWPIETPFRSFAYVQEYKWYKENGYTIEHWAKNYSGIVLQSSSGLPTLY